MRRKRNHSIKRLSSLYLFCIIILLIVFFLSNSQNFSFFPKPIVSPLAFSNKSTKIVDRASIERLLSQKKIEYNTVVSATDSSYAVRLADGGEVIFSATKDIAIQISSLQLILSRFTIEGKRLSKLDFRYTNPIIVLGN